VKTAVAPLARDRFLLGFLTALGEFGRGERVTASTTAMRKVHEAFEGDREEVRCFFARFHALRELFNHPDAERYVFEHPEDPEKIRFHPAVLCTAAEFRLNKNGRFPREKFLARVEATARTEFPGWPDA
jgi:hypothetical protein